MTTLTVLVATSVVIIADRIPLRTTTVIPVPHQWETCESTNKYMNDGAGFRGLWGLSRFLSQGFNDVLYGSSARNIHEAAGKAAGILCLQARFPNPYFGGLNK